MHMQARTLLRPCVIPTLATSGACSLPTQLRKRRRKASGGPAYGESMDPASADTCYDSQAGTRVNALPNLVEIASQPVVRDVGALTLTVVGSILWVKIFDYFCKRGYLEQKLSRKLVHITTGPIFAFCWVLFSQAEYARYIAAIVPAANCVRLLSVGAGYTTDEGLTKTLSRENKREELLRGPFFYTIVMGVATVAFWRESTIGFVMLGMMCGGDGLADVIGRRIGKNKLPWNTDKTVEGSVAMFFGGMLMALGLLSFYQSVGYLTLTPDTFYMVLGPALVATLVESLPITTIIDDNLTVPVAAAMAALAVSNMIPAQAVLGY
ncbi:hypothetical protein BSKO_00966 [Bryopsis sp. KO-2023]|nr:hypothetical protein BSKO_00966 [Bryopsis sp. KO-2023]